MKSLKKQPTLKTVPIKNENISEFLIEFMRDKGIGGKEFNFDQIEHIRCEKHYELKDNFILTETKEYQKNDIICSTCLSELNRKYDDYLKSKLYSGIIYDNKEKILQIKESKINFELFTIGKSLQVHTHNDILCLGDELIKFSKSFEDNVIDKFTTCKTSHDEIEKIKKFIIQILNEKNEPNLRGIGNNEDLKIRYIQLAYFLIKFRGLRKEELDHTGLTDRLKNHILEIIKKRKKVNKSIDKWLELVLGEFYSYTQELENLPYDQEFYRSVEREYIGKNTLREIERLKRAVKDKDNENEQLKKVKY